MPKQQKHWRNKELSEEEILMYSKFIDNNLYKKLFKNTCEGVQF